MVLAAYRNDLIYELLLFAHILSAIVGVGSLFGWAGVGSRAAEAGVNDDGAARLVAVGTRTLSAPAVYAMGVTGLLTALVGNGEAVELSDPWLSAAMLLYLAAVGVMVFLLVPAQRAVAAGTASVDEAKKPAMFTGILHTLFAVALVLMVFQPG